MVKNKKGWIKVIEAFLSIMLLMSLLFLVFNNNSDSNENVRRAIERKESEFLKEIELNQTLRDDILGANVLPVTSNLDSFPGIFRNYTKEEFKNENCIFKLCSAEEECVLNTTISQEIDGEIYLKSILIHSNRTLHSPKKLSIICSPDKLLSDYFPACDDELRNGDEFGVDCGGSCSTCLYCISTETRTEEGVVTFECEGHSQGSCETLKFCNWVEPNCERKTCGEISFDECVQGNGCVASNKLE